MLSDVGFNLSGSMIFEKYILKDFSDIFLYIKIQSPIVHVQVAKPYAEL